MTQRLTPMNTDLHQQLIEDLLVESFEGLDHFDRDLLALEGGRTDTETLNSIFRIIHTIKGTSGCLGVSQIETVAHAGENLLDLLRSGQIDVSSELISTLLSLSDSLRALLRNLEQTGSPGDTDHSQLIGRLLGLAHPDSPTPAVPPASHTAEPIAHQDPGWGLFEDEPPIAPPSAAAPPPATPAPVVPPGRTEPRPTDATSKPGVEESAIRVDVQQLDRLMNLVGELVLARNQILQFTAGSHGSGLLAVSQRLNLITTELQESVMKTRMQPIGTVWAKFPRVVRDVAKDLGKRVKLIMQGQDTELDRTIVEAIKDPLTHIVRNSIDHGIETPDARAALGKPAEGMLVLRAYHEGGQVNIEILDDGRGINVEKVKAKAVQNNLLTPDQAARLSEREALNLIFLPGLSTADKITNVSGRGVGMDVVKTNIEKTGGSIDIQSERDRGTTIKIKIPLTLAIIPALIINSGGDRFAIPQVSLLELVRLEGTQAARGIEDLYGTQVYRLRGKLLPLVKLNQILEIGSDSDSPAADIINIVVLQADGHQFGLIVDHINDTEEIVVKPLGKQLKGLTTFAGATIMGDGKVALILDVLGLAQRASIIDESHDHRLLEKATSTDGTTSTRQSMLVFSVGKTGLLAIPLAQAARLEEIPANRVEHTGTREVVQYRGRIMPLLHVDQFLPGTCPSPPAADQPMQVVVYSEHGRNVGLVVDRIHDIVEESLVIDRSAHAPGILGSAVIQDRVTDLLDVPGLLQLAGPGFTETPQ